MENNLYSQLQDNSMPPDFHTKREMQEKISVLNLDQPSSVEDSFIDPEDKSIKFAAEIPVNIDFFEKATKSESMGEAIYRIEIQAAGAYSLSLNFAMFQTSPHGKLWVYNQEKNLIKGAFHSGLNRNSNSFAIAPIPGNSLLIEYREPLAEQGMAMIQLQSVMYGFKNIFSMWDTKNFGSSGSCNVNINCPEGSDWQLHKRSVGMILTSNNSRICTGTLINNNKNDGTPYFLTARHCNVQTNAIVMFNYESPDCSNLDGNTFQTLQGCEKVAEWAPSDFTLLKLLDTPPLNYTVYYAGWSAMPVPNFPTASIHHPRGDIKKISTDTDTPVIAVYSGSDTTRNHWRINTWEIGTTEPGSSGSPLFDANQRVIGQLHGGMATCANSINDYYGMFYYSWNGGGQPENSLKPWLDPDQTGVNVNDGLNPNVSAFNYDLGISQLVVEETNTCESVIYPNVVVSNLGNLELNSFRIECGGIVLDTNLIIQPFASKTIKLKAISLNLGVNSLKAQVKILSPGVDQNPVNDTLSINVTRNPGEQIQVIITTDNFGSETSWEIFDDDYQLVANGGGYAGNQTYVHKYCLTPGCYQFTIYDSDGDGMCCAAGEGSYKILDKKGNILSSGGNFTNREDSKFCVPFYLQGFDDVAVFPNPAQGELNVLITGLVSGKSGFIIISDMQGKVVYNFAGKLKYLNNFDVSNLSSGVYGIKVISGEFIRKIKFVKI